MGDKRKLRVAGPVLLAGALAGLGASVAPPASAAPAAGPGSQVEGTCPGWSGAQPPAVGGGGHLAGVAMVSACDVWTVGWDGSSPSRALVEHWTGGSDWVVVPSPGPGASSSLTQVVAVSAGDVWAVGKQSDAAGVSSTLIEHWDGSNWAQVPSPSPGTDGQLTGISAAAGNDIWAVGSFQGPRPGTSTLIEHWDGTKWTQVASANPGTSNELSGVSVASPANVWAVGDDTTLGSASPHALIERWDGTRWTQAAAPALGTSSKLTGVNMGDNFFAPGEDTSGTVVGQFTPAGSSTPHTLIENFNVVSGWQQVASPSPGRDASTLTALSGGWAVGTATSGGQQHPLLLREGLESVKDTAEWHQVPLPAQDDDVALSAVGVALSAVGTASPGLWIAGTKAGSRPFAAPVPADIGPVQIAVNTGATLFEAGLTTGSPNVPQPRGTVDPVSTPVAVNSDGDTEIAWAKNGDNHLWTLNSDGFAVDWGDQVATDSNPAIAAVPDRGFVFAFARLGDHLLKVSTPDVTDPQQVGTGFDLAADTSPAVAASPQGGYEIAFAASAANDLETVGPDGIAHGTGMRVMPASSPAITALPGGGYEIAFANAADHKVWEIGPDGNPVQAAVTEPAVAQVTSTPAIAASADGGVEVTFIADSPPQGGDEDLWYIDPAGNGHDTGLSTFFASPAIVALPGGGFEIAYSDFHDTLTTLTPGGQPQHSNIFVGAQPGIAVPIPAAPRTVTVPNLLGRDVDDVKKDLPDIRLAVGRITLDNRCIDVKGTVLEQDPTGGARVPEGTPVDMLVSSGVSDDNGDPCIFK